MDGVQQATTLYRLFDAKDVLLYVGISGKWFARMGQHATKKGWWDDVATVKREVLPSRAEALAAERRAIRAEKPLHNVQGAPPKKPKRATAPKLQRPSPPRPQAARDELVIQLRDQGLTGLEIRERLGIGHEALRSSIRRLVSAGRTTPLPVGGAALPPERRRRGTLKEWRAAQRRS